MHIAQHKPYCIRQEAKVSQRDRMTLRVIEYFDN